jgi:acyl carrier protein
MADIDARTRLVLDAFKQTPGLLDWIVITPESPFESHVPDSLRRVELVMEAERVFGIEVPDSDFAEGETVGELAEAVAKSIAQGGRLREAAPHRFESWRA